VEEIGARNCDASADALNVSLDQCRRNFAAMEPFAAGGVGCNLASFMCRPAGRTASKIRTSSQSGPYLGEVDIVRLEDVYPRT
jgi:hypothetical protein